MTSGALRLLARLTGTAVRVYGLDRLPGGPSIIVANHPSWIDPFALAAVLPPSFHFVAGEVFRDQVLSGFVLRRLGTQFVERHEREVGVADTDRLVALVGSGQSLVIFPEGRMAASRGCGLFTWAHSSWPPRRACRSSPSEFGGPGQVCGPSTTFHDEERSTSSSVNRCSHWARTGLRPSSCSARCGTPSCTFRGSRTPNEGRDRGRSALSGRAARCFAS
jgi:1-acyl-sn-glycerol-3-phosphate acyltransferase